MIAFYGQAKADFLERSRRFSFIAMIALALFGAFFFVPSQTQDGFSFLSIMPDIFYQVSNPTWIPVASAMGTGFFLMLMGLFYLRTGVSFDEKVGIDQLVLASPTGNSAYLIAKFLSGTLLLTYIAAITMLGSYVMAVIHFPGEVLPLRTFLVPYAFLVATLPVTSAFAVFFSSVRPLRGALGAVIYIFAFLVLLDMKMEMHIDSAPRIMTLFQRSLDFSGITYVRDIIKFAVYESLGSYSLLGVTFLGGFIQETFTPSEHLVFTVMPFGTHELAAFGLMLIYACGLVVLSAPFLSISRKWQNVKMFEKRTIEVVSPVGTNEALPKYFAVKNTGKLNRLTGITSELKLMLKGHSLMWKFVAVVGLGLSMFLDLGVVQRIIIPLLMLWFISVFSSMGYRERHHDMLQIISTMPKGRLRQVINSYAAGLFVMFVLLLPVMVRMAVADQYPGIAVAVSAAMFIPSFALFLGEYTKTNRIFEMLMIFFTYLILNGFHLLSYVGLYPDILSMTRGAAFLGMGIVLGVAAVLKRIRTL